MSNNSRTDPAYGNSNVDISFAENEHILNWWTEAHDNLILNAIKVKRWNWEDKITEEIMNITPKETFENWINIDPVCKKYSWYNILVYFAKARAKVKGFERLIPVPEWKICPLCNQKFIESSLSFPFVHRLGYSHLDFCPLCLRDLIYSNTGNPEMTKEEIISYIIELTNVLERIPPQGFGEGQNDLEDFNFEERIKIFKVLKRKPTNQRVKQLFGSWLNALIKAKVLENDVRKTSRGTQCIAKDGHVCFSLGEKTIDDLLFFLKIPHSKEPQYPESNYRADFKVKQILIEYFGLIGNVDYDTKMSEKMKICEKNGVKLLSILPKDLMNIHKLKILFLSELS